MIVKKTILILTACSLPLLPAQEAPPKEPEAKNDPEAAAEVKPEGPLEKRAFEIYAVIEALPGILSSVEDEATLAAAQTQLDKMSEKLAVETAKLKKLPLPPNDARLKLNQKMMLKEQAMQQEMQAAMLGMQALDPKIAQKVGQMFMGFGQKMQEFGPIIDKYFKPDEEKEKDGE